MKLSDELRLSLAKSPDAETRYAVFIRVVEGTDPGVLEIPDLQVETWAGDIAVAIASTDAIAKAAALQEVIHISLSGTTQPLRKRPPTEP